jgi:ParB/RepB/Spo0J family partition protein
MDTIANKNVMVIEHHCLQLGYAHLRAQNPKALEKLTTSIEHYGQLVPVVVVPEDPRQWVLIDGYQRVKALKRLGKDTLAAEVWHCTLTEALIMLFKSHSIRSPGAFEEALLLHELHTQHNLSQQTLAKRVGRDQSWISRRLSLVEHLPESILENLSKGSLSLWTGVRILAPMARAIPEHAECLLTYLLKHPHSTREVHSFYEHYQKSTSPARAKMVDHPDLFFKAQRFLEAEKQTITLKNGPEGKWRAQCHTLIALLSELTLLAPSIFFRQTREMSRQPLEEFKRAVDKFDELRKTIRELVDC